MNAYSVDRRERVLEAVASGTARQEAARLFRVSVPSIDRWLRLQRATGQVAAKPRPGRKRHIRPEQHLHLAAQLRLEPDASLAQHCHQWSQQQGTGVSVATMSRALARLGWTHKKSR